MLRLTPRYIHFPRSRRETAEVIEQLEFFFQCRIPKVLGNLDGTHIPVDHLTLMDKQIILVENNVTLFADKELLEQIFFFSKSQLGFQEAATMPIISEIPHCKFFSENGEILTKPEDVIENSRVTSLVLGDEAYPLLPWLIKPYNFGPALTRSEKLFNKKFCSARVTAERTFGILKVCWRC